MFRAEQNIQEIKENNLFINMKNIQAQYSDLLEGKMSQANFVRNVRMQFPQHISPSTSFEDSVKILKSKRILTETTIKEYGERYTDPDSEDFSLAVGEYIESEDLTPEQMEAALDYLEQNSYDLQGDYANTHDIDGGTGEAARYVINLVKQQHPDPVLRAASLKLHRTRNDGEFTDAIKKGEEEEAGKYNKFQDFEGGISEVTLNEAKQSKGVYGHNPNAEAPKSRNIDHLDYYQVQRGTEYELSKMSVISDENYLKAREKAVSNILKNPDAYRELQLANFKAVRETDKDLRMKEVKKDNLVDKPNGLKAVKKDEKSNTQDTLGKKEAKKSKTAKVPVMTQAPKGKLKAFPTPGKEKVIALKEHLIDEMTSQNPFHESLNKGSRVKKKDNSKAGEIIEFDGHTATVKWDDGGVEDIQKNVLTRQDVPPPPSNYENPLAKMPDIGTSAQKWLSSIAKDDKIKSLKEKLMKTVKEMMYKKGNQTVTASSDQSKTALKQAGYREVPNTQDVRAI